MNPRNGGMFVVRQMPVMIQPQPINGFPQPEIAGTARYMPFRAVVMHVLHRRPGESKTEIHDRIVEDWDSQPPHNENMQSDRGQAFRLDQSPINRIQRFHERGGGTVEIPVTFVRCEGEQQKHHVSEHHHDPVTARENSVEHQTTPQAMILLEIKVERFVIGTVAEMMSKMALANEMKRRGKKQRHERSRKIVPATILEQDRMFRFVNNRIDGIHHDAERNGERCKAPAALDAGGCKKADCKGRELADDDCDVQSLGNGSRFLP